MDVPEKFKKIIDDLQNDRSQVIDLSGAELGDTIILNILEYVKRSKKLKVLKLIRNKISDEVFPEIIKACCFSEESNISSLNVSQNMLS